MPRGHEIKEVEIRDVIFKTNPKNSKEVNDSIREHNELYNSKENLRCILNDKNMYIRELQGRLRVINLLRDYEIGAKEVKNKGTVIYPRLQEYLTTIDYKYKIIDLSVLRKPSPKIYFLFYKSSLIYIGKTVSAWPQRIENHFDKKFDDARAIIILDEISEKELLEFESELIAEFTPVYNKRR